MSDCPNTFRRSDARLSGGFAWAPVRRGESPTLEPDELALSGCVGATLRLSGHDRSIDVVHATGMAHLLAGEPVQAAVDLDNAAGRAPHDAGVWNDLAAARYEEAVALDAPDRLPSALAAVDHALGFAPAMQEARFNRALILAQIGLRGDARKAWLESLVVEHDSRWAAEGRRHMRDVAVIDDPPMTSELDRALGSDDAAIRDLVRRRPQEARTAGETLILAAWGDAAARGDRPAEERELRKARSIGTALILANGDRLLAEIVRTIDSAPLGSGARARLVAAHRAYRNARQHYSRKLAGSDDELDRCAERFAPTGSPMVNVARYYSANASFDRNRVERAREHLEMVLRAIDPNRYPSLSAGAEKELGLYYGFRGMWTASLLHLDRAVATFKRLGEVSNAAFAEAIVGEVHDRIARPDEGWRHRRSALAVLTRHAGDARFVAVLGGGVQAEILRGDNDGALALLRIGLDHAIRVGDAELAAEMIVREARVLLAVGNSAEAQAAVAKAKVIAGRIADRRMRDGVVAGITLVEGEILGRSDPLHAISVLTAAISSYEANAFGMLLPLAYLQRGRAHLACGQGAAALADFERGLAEIERQRANVALDLRATLFNTVPDLVAETVDLLLARGRKENAYAIVERTRARTLIEALGRRVRASERVSSQAVGAALPANALVVEYAFLPHGLAVFCISRKGMTVHRLSIDPVRLRDQAGSFATAIIDRRPIEEVQQRSAELHAALVAPFQTRLADASILYVIPDRSLSALPFSALFDPARRQYLIERTRIVICPSSAFLVARRHARVRLTPALVIGDPVSAVGRPALPSVRYEGEAVASLYGCSVIPREEATVDRFARLAPASALIHYAGHAQTDDTAGGFLPLAPSPGSDGRLDATAIAHLRLERTRIVVLSACATLRGNFAHVEGMPSIARAFLTAGVPSVIGMLWDVDDAEATVLALEIHRALHNGASPAAALQAAQRKFAGSADLRRRHPASWAAAELLGVD